MSSYDRFYNNPSRAIPQLNKQAMRRERAEIVSPDSGQAFTPDQSLPVRAGQSIIRKASFTRLPGPKSYDNYSVVSGNIANNFQFDTAINEDSNLSSGIIIGGKMSRQNPSSAGAWFRLWLYLGNPNSPGINQTPPQLFDGTKFNISWSRRDIRIGYLDFNTFESGTDCSESPAYVSVGQSLLFELVDGTIYGRLQARSQIDMLSSEEVDLYLYITADGGSN